MYFARGIISLTSALEWPLLNLNKIAELFDMSWSRLNLTMKIKHCCVHIMMNWWLLFSSTESDVDKYLPSINLIIVNALMTVSNTWRLFRYLAKSALPYVNSKLEVFGFNYVARHWQVSCSFDLQIRMKPSFMPLQSS